MSVLRHTLVLICASAVLASCGLKGPLKAPKKPTPTSTTTSPPPPTGSPQQGTTSPPPKS